MGAFDDLVPGNSQSLIASPSLDRVPPDLQRARDRRRSQLLQDELAANPNDEALKREIGFDEQRQNTFEDLVPPQKPVIQKPEAAGFAETYPPAVSGGIGWSGKKTGLALSAPAILADEIAKSFAADPWHTITSPIATTGAAVGRMARGQTTGGPLQDFMFEHLVDPSHRNIEAGQVPPGQEMTTGGKVGAVTGQVVGTLPEMIMGAGGAGTARDAAMKAGDTVMQGVTRVLGHGVVASQPVAQTSALSTYENLIAQGVDPVTARAAAAREYGVNTIGMAVAPSVPGGVVRRAVSGAASNVISGVAADVAGNQKLQDAGYMQQQRQLDDPVARATEAIMGALFGVAGGPRAGTVPRVLPREAAAHTADIQAGEQARADFEKYRPILEANGITDSNSLAAQSAVNILRAREQRMGERAAQAATEQQPPTPPEQLPQRPQGTIYVDPQGRAATRETATTPAGREISLPTGEKVGMLAAGGEQAATETGARRAFDVAGEQAQRKTQAEGTLMDLREARAGGTISPEGTRATEPQQFTFLDARKEGGQMISGDRIEVVETGLKIPKAEGSTETEPATRVRMPNGEEVVVPDRRLSTEQRPTNPRFAQDIAATTYAPPRGAGTLAEQPVPREAAQRITGPRPQEVPRAPQDRLQRQDNLPERQGTDPQLQGQRQAREQPPVVAREGAQTGGGNRLQQGRTEQQVGREFSGSYSDGSSWRTVYSAVKRTDGSFALIRKIKDVDGERTEHLRADGTWAKGEPPRTAAFGAHIEDTGPHSFSSIEAALAEGKNDAISMGGKEGTQQQEPVITQGEPHGIPAERPAVSVNRIQPEPETAAAERGAAGGERRQHPAAGAERPQDVAQQGQAEQRMAPQEERRAPAAREAPVQAGPVRGVEQRSGTERRVGMRERIRDLKIGPRLKEAWEASKPITRGEGGATQTRRAYDAFVRGPEPQVARFGRRYSDAAREAAKQSPEQAKDLPGNDSATLYANPFHKVLGWAVGDSEKWADKLKELANVLEDVKKDPKKMTLANNPAVNMARAIFDSAAANMRAIGRRSDSKTIQWVADQFHDEAGTGRATGEIMQDAVKAHVGQRLVQLDRILGESVGPSGERARMINDRPMMQQIANLIRNPSQIRPGSKIHDAAAKIIPLLADELKYAREAGVDVGEVKGGYFPREFDESRVAADPNGFMSATAQAYRENGLGAQAAIESGRALHDGIMYGESNSLYRPDTGMTSAPFLKARVFGKQVDLESHPLNKFLVSDPSIVLARYFNKMAKRAEIARRFGEDFSHWQDWTDAKGKKQEGIATKIINEGGGDALDQVKDFIGLGASLRPQGVSNFGLRASSHIRTWGALMFLEKATISNATEFIVPAVRSGNVLDVARMFSYTLADLVRVTKGAEERRANAEDLGLVYGHVQGGLQAARFAGGDVIGRVESQVLDNFFQRTGLTQLTDAQRVGSARLSQIFVRRLAKEAAGKLNTRYLGELGVPPEQIKQFKDFVLSKGDGMPAAGDLQGPMGVLYRTAVRKFTNQGIQVPNAAQRPTYMNKPIGAILGQLQAFNYGFMENVIKRSGRLAKEAVVGSDYTAYERANMVMPVMMLPLITAAAYALGEARDAVLGDPEHRAEETTTQKVIKAVSRGTPIAPIDPLINYISSARYRSTSTSVLAGPVIGTFGKAIDSARDYFFANSEKSNTQERRALKALWDIAIEPTVNLMLYATVPSPVAAAITQAAGSGWVREKMFVEPIAGAKEEKGGGSGGQHGMGHVPLHGGGHQATHGATR